MPSCENQTMAKLGAFLVLLFSAMVVTSWVPVLPYVAVTAAPEPTILTETHGSIYK
jgi:hypothetical protein